MQTPNFKTAVNKTLGDVTDAFIIFTVYLQQWIAAEVGQHSD